MTTDKTPKTVEETEIRTNIREIIRFVGFVAGAITIIYTIKSDIKDLGSEYKIDKKVTEIRLQAIELRLSQIEAEQKESKKQRENDLIEAAK